MPRVPWLMPAIVLVILYWLARGAATFLFPGTMAQFMTLFYAPLVLTLALIIWWLGLSRLAWADRLWGPLALIATGLAIVPFVDRSMPLSLMLFALPLAASLAIGWLLITRGAAGWGLRFGLLAICALAWGYYALLRCDGVDGNLVGDIQWRWSPSAEERFLAERTSAADQKPALPAAETPVQLVATSADWPEFRGVNRDSRRAGVRIDPNWKDHPPQEQWRKRIGPGWGTFCVVGDYLFTQDQRGEEEAVVCLDRDTGEERWVHTYKSRFWEVVAGAGPRATPTFHEGKLFAFGGSGILNCLDAATGNLLWSKNVAEDAKATLPMWGFSSSPLVAHGLVTVFAGGPDGSEVIAYDIATGERKWSAGKGKLSYCSTQLQRVGEHEQLLIASDEGLESFDPETGKLLWDHEWAIQGMARVVQPHWLGDGKLLVGTGYGHGTRLLTITPQGDEWNIDEGWTSKELKPYFNDFVTHEGFAYGFDGSLFTCLDLSTGKRAWKKGRYGHGQVLLLSEQGLLVVVSEAGEVILLEANPQKHVELGKLAALKGKTWNHPVVAGDQLLVRNGEEMASYKLALEQPVQQPQ
ncbi:PQQ-binding-like beta-propeller repeat protein [Anatilimnocola sp. NA78]|uniref:PQQ-binding-like beta-propeller repeat protein n=1 Tax=Anatilimnocola sp. NA78 TaxID=3415683 RepID=UPI003CE5AD2E